jgi:hypothetical protein
MIDDLYPRGRVEAGGRRRGDRDQLVAIDPGATFTEETGRVLQG